jgi:multiple sugar transport system substrate-binding protein
VHHISTLWHEKGWDSAFDNTKASVQVDNKVYALPISFYQWGFYYNKAEFVRLGLRPPENWAAFIRLCKAIKALDKYPIIFGIKDDWPAASWFSYLNLRLNGRAFHLDLLQGNISFKDARLQTVFKHWQQLLEGDYFHPKGLKANDKQILTYLYRNEALMTLSGNFITKHMDSEYRDSFDFFGFPVIDEQQGRYEEAPTDVLFINKDSENISAAETFLAFMAQPDILRLFNETVGYISPNRHSRLSENNFVQKGANWLQSADGTTMFLDRDSHSDFSGPVFKALGQHMREPDITKTITDLEKARALIPQKTNQ